MASSELLEAQHSLRIDRWLWCARFFKTRSSAATAVKGGHVRLNGQRTKPAKSVQVGDFIRIAKGTVVFEVAVTAIPTRRGPASEATQCYFESEESVQKRRLRSTKRRSTADAMAAPTAGRPDKRTRRLIRSRIKDSASPE